MLKNLLFLIINFYLKKYTISIVFAINLFKIIYNLWLIKSKYYL